VHRGVDRWIDVRRAQSGGERRRHDRDPAIVVALRVQTRREIARLVTP
jgi:hypothetical protein